MPRIVITHAVQDVDRWLRGKAERAGALPGATDITDLVAMDGSNHAAVAFNIDDLDTLKAVLSSIPPEMAAQAESHGVVVPTMTAYVQALGLHPAGGRLRGAQRLQQPVRRSLRLFPDSCQHRPGPRMARSRREEICGRS